MYSIGIQIVLFQMETYKKTKNEFVWSLLKISTYGLLKEMNKRLNEANKTHNNIILKKNKNQIKNQIKSNE